MKIYIGADHRGFRLKTALRSFLEKGEYALEDVGNLKEDTSDNYADFAAEVARKVGADSEARGIVICGSGAGVDFTANKFKGVRAALGFSSAQVIDARRDDDINVLALAADFTSEVEAEEIVERFLKTPFSGEERHVRRLQKVKGFEAMN